MVNIKINMSVNISNARLKFTIFLGIMPPIIDLAPLKKNKEKGAKKRKKEEKNALPCLRAWVVMVMVLMLLQWKLCY